MGQFLENLAMESRRIPPPPPPLPPFFAQAIHPHHPYLSQVLLNNSFINQFSSTAAAFNRFAPPPKDFPFHFSTPKKRRTKVNEYLS
jgi:hypothetical protein